MRREQYDVADNAFSRAANIHSPVCPLTDPAVKSSGQMLLFRQQAASVLLSPTIIGLKIRVTLADHQSIWQVGEAGGMVAVRGQSYEG